jgi:hypothetical protein
MMASVRFSARINGFANSKFAPMPLNSNNGGRPLGPRLMATRKDCAPTAIILTSN